MSKATSTEQAQTAAAEAMARLEEMESEIRALPEQIRQAEKRARASKTEAEVEEHLAEKDRLERRRTTLPYLIPQQRITALRARAVLEGERHERIKTEFPPAIAERDEAQVAFEQAEKRLKEAEAVVKRLTVSASGAHFNHQMLLIDADNIAAGKETTKYFTSSGSGL